MSLVCGRYMVDNVVRMLSLCRHYMVGTIGRYNWSVTWFVCCRYVVNMLLVHGR